VAEVVFGDPDQRAWLEGALWPRVGERIFSWREQQDSADPRPLAAVVEVPLLFEAGMEAGFDSTIAVVADESVRSERAGTRGHRGVESRTSRQLTQDEKARRADVVVRNDGTLEELEQGLSRALATIGPK
jgi:dephospho-CoA kinase